MLGLDVYCTDFNTDIYNDWRAVRRLLEDRNLSLSVIYLPYLQIQYSPLSRRSINILMD